MMMQARLTIELNQETYLFQRPLEVCVCARRKREVKAIKPVGKRSYKSKFKGVRLFLFNSHCGDGHPYCCLGLSNFGGRGLVKGRHFGKAIKRC